MEKDLFLRSVFGSYISFRKIKVLDIFNTDKRMFYENKYRIMSSRDMDKDPIIFIYTTDPDPHHW